MGGLGRNSQTIFHTLYFEVARRANRRGTYRSGTYLQESLCEGTIENVKLNKSYPGRNP